MNKEILEPVSKKLLEGDSETGKIYLPNAHALTE